MKQIQTQIFSQFVIIIMQIRQLNDGSVSTKFISKQPSFDKLDNTNPDNRSQYTNIIAPTPRTHDKEFSVRAVSTNSKQNYSRISQHSQQLYEQERLSRISESAITNYEAIERILKNQNNNLKKQNELLMNQVHRLKNSNRKYKEMCLSQRIEMQAMKEECEAQKSRADEMKQIILNRLMMLEKKALGETEGNSLLQCEQLLDALNYSESGRQQQP